MVDFDLKKEGGVGQGVFRGTPDCGGGCLYFAEGFKNCVAGMPGSNCYFVFVAEIDRLPQPTESDTGLRRGLDGFRRLLEG